MTTVATATVLGGFWPTNGVNSLGSMSGEGEERRQVAKALGHRSMLPIREVWRALTGAAPGATATKNLTRIANSTELGGVRAIETVALVNRVTTAADVTEIVADFLTYTTGQRLVRTRPRILIVTPLARDSVSHTMAQKRTVSLEDDQRKEIVNELYGLLNDMTRNAPTSPAEGAGNEKVRTVISKILSMVETDEERQLREQSSQSSRGGLPNLNERR